MSETAFRDAATWVLDQAVEALGDTAPDLRWIQWGQSINEIEWVDCCDKGGQLNVFVGRIVPLARPAAVSPSCASGWSIPITIQVLRCAPAPKNGRPPTTDKIVEDHRKRLVEAQQLSCHMLAALGDIDGYDGRVDALTTIEEGACRAVRVELTVHLP